MWARVDVKLVVLVMPRKTPTCFFNRNIAFSVSLNNFFITETCLKRIYWFKATLTSMFCFVSKLNILCLKLDGCHVPVKATDHRFAWKHLSWFQPLLHHPVSWQCECTSIFHDVPFCVSLPGVHHHNRAGNHDEQ